MCIITSLNLYEFSQVNNNEMGVLIQRSEDNELYRDAYDEAQRIIRVSDEVRISLERVVGESTEKDAAVAGDEASDANTPEKLTSSKLALKLGLKTHDLMDKLVQTGLLEPRDGKHYITAKGKEVGGEFRMSPKFGPYFLWPQDLTV
jgi:phosphatidylserine/phosphatidylglycerophosphate/cardiolipin synthase-like enzyme